MVRSSQSNTSVSRSTSQTPTSEAASANSSRHDSRDSSASRSRMNASLRWRAATSCAAPKIGATISSPASTKSARGPQSAGGGSQPPFGTAAICQAPAGSATSAVTGSCPRIAGVAEERLAIADLAVPAGQHHVEPEAGIAQPAAR